MKRRPSGKPVHEQIRLRSTTVKKFLAHDWMDVQTTTGCDPTCTVSGPSYVQTKYLPLIYHGFRLDSSVWCLFKYYSTYIFVKFLK